MSRHSATWLSLTLSWSNLDRTWPSLVPNSPKLASTWPDLAPTWPNLTPTWRQLGVNLGPNLGPTWPNLAQLGPTWPNFVQLDLNLAQTRLFWGVLGHFWLLLSRSWTTFGRIVCVKQSSPAPPSADVLADDCGIEDAAPEQLHPARRLCEAP